jgi:hypothetical protein
MPERMNPVEWLRGVALSLERLAAQGVAGGAVRGATEELRSGLPDELDKVAEDVLTTLARLAAEAARARTSPLETWSTRAAAGAVRGAVEEMRRLVPGMESMNRDLLARVKLWLDRSASEAGERAQVIQAPGDRARIAAAGAIRGAADQLEKALPELAPPAAEFASRVGRALVRGTAEEVGRQLRRVGRQPLVWAVVAGGVVVAVLAAARRR